MSLCPQCGHCLDARLDRDVEIGRLTVGPDRAWWCGRSLVLPKGQFAVLRTLALAYPRVLSKDALMIRLGIEDRTENLLSVQLSHLRKTLLRQGVPGHRVVRTFARRGLVLMDEDGEAKAA